MRRKCKTPRRRRPNSRATKRKQNAVLLDIMKTMMWMHQTYSAAEKKKLSQHGIMDQKDIIQLVFLGLYYVTDRDRDTIILKCWCCSKCFKNWTSIQHLKENHDCNWTEIISHYI